MSGPWPMVPLSRVLQLQRRWLQPEPARAYTEIGIRSFGKGIFQKNPVSGLSLGDKKVLRIEPGDLVFMNVFAWEGAVGVAGTSEAGTIGSHRFATFTPLGESADVNFLRLFFTTTAGRDLLGRVSPGSAGRNRTMNLSAFAEQVVPLPPIGEQRRIVARVDALAAKIAEARGLRENVATLIDRLMARFQSDLFRADWSHQGVRQLIESNDSGWSPQCEERPALPDEWGVLKTTSVQWTGFTPSQNKALMPGQIPRPEIVVKDGDVLITRAGPVNRVGVSCVAFKTNGRLMLSDKIVRLRVRRDLVLPEFFVTALAQPDVQERFRQKQDRSC